ADEERAVLLEGYGRVDDRAGAFEQDDLHQDAAVVAVLLRQHHQVSAAGYFEDELPAKSDLLPLLLYQVVRGVAKEASETRLELAESLVELLTGIAGENAADPQRHRLARGGELRCDACDGRQDGVTRRGAKTHSMASKLTGSAVSTSASPANS